MKKWGIVLLALLLVLSLAACSSGDAGEPEGDATWARIQAEGKTTVGLDDTFAPMGFREAGTNDLIGFDIDMVEEFSARLGIEFEWIPTEWRGVTGSLNSNKFDMVINGMSITDERQEAINFSIPYVKAGIGAVVLADNTEINSIDDLWDFNLATQTGSSASEALRGIGYEDPVYYDQYPLAFQDLSIGRVDAVIVDATTGAHFMDMKPGEYRLIEGRVVDEYYAIGLRKADTELAEALNGVLRDMMEDGTLAAISEKWFGTDLIAYE